MSSPYGSVKTDPAEYKRMQQELRRDNQISYAFLVVLIFLGGNAAYWIGFAIGKFINVIH